MSGEGQREALAESVAIIGMAGRFPRADDLDQLWRNLRDGVEAVTFFSDEELREAGVDPALLADPSYVKAHAIVEGIELFDADFFDLNPRVAAVTDPQHRLFLECAWQALEDAACDPRRFDGLIGVFAGASMNTYFLSRLLAGADFGELVGGIQTMIASQGDYLATQVAYRFDLKGPAMGVQTACSTSLVAVHLACQGLLEYQCDVALAGGVKLRIPARAGYRYAEGGIYSPDGHCRPFDAAAQGTLSGNGAGVVVLKRLADALADGDRIRAVVRGSAINNDGADKVGFTAPSIDGQAAVIAMAQAVAGVEPASIGLVEAHGTGTPLGDPIEVAALRRVFREVETPAACALGSVKANFGHLDAAAGIAGLIKAVLALEHRQIPPCVNFERPNPRLELEGSPFYVNAELADWPAEGEPRRAGVSSFGIGGTNAHLVLEEAPAREGGDPAREWQPLVVSARTTTALESASERLRVHLEETSDPLAEVAYTLQLGRRPLEHRRVVVARDATGAARALEAGDPRRVLTGSPPAEAPPVVFLFPGQGAQHAGMAAELYRAEGEVRRAIDRCCELAEPHLGVDLRRELFAEGARAEAALRETRLAQPALFAVEYALARLWASWGVEPRAMVGHSLGEYVAACLAGVFTLADALALVAARGRLMQELAGGAMTAVHLGEDETLSRLSGGLSLAAVNRPALCVVSGPEAEVAALEAALETEAVGWRRLHTSHAFHSAMMEPAMAGFAEVLREVPLEAPDRPFVSSLTGTWIRAEEATDPDYWLRQLRRPVRFSKAVEELTREGGAVFLEVGPGTTLGSLVRRHPARGPSHAVVSTLAHPKDGRPEGEAVAAALGELWLGGVEVDWRKVHGEARRLRVALPTYPFERRRCWLEAPSRPRRRAPSARRELAHWGWVPSWKRLPALPAPELEAGESWLLLADEEGLGEELGRRLEAAGQEVVRVRPGGGFERAGAGRYRCAPGEAEPLAALVEELCAAGGPPRRIVHAWSLEPAADGTPDADAARELVDRAFYGLLFLAQALGRHAPGAPVQLDVVASGLWDVAGGERVVAERATLLGPCQVLPREVPGMSCRAIDVAAGADTDTGTGDGSGTGELAEQILAELLAEPGEPLVALRRGRRWARCFEPLELAPAPTSTSTSGSSSMPRLRRGGVYLITGGLGGLGLALAEHLAREHGARLVLTGRRPPPERASWEALLERRPDDPWAAKVRRLLALEALGAEVMAAGADVTDEAQMRGVVERARERFGALDGVIHAAGAPPSGAAQLKTRAMAEAVLGPKVLGARVLERVLAAERVDFLVLFSSYNSVLGQAGGLDYCAANAFLDAFAAARRGQGRGPLTLAIGWCGWREVGMLADAAARRRPRRSPAPAPVGPGGLDGLGEALDHPLLDRGWRRPGGGLATVTRFTTRDHWLLDEHRIGGQALIPGTGYLEMVRAAVASLGWDGDLELRDVFFLAPVRVRDDEAREVRLELEPRDEGFAFRAWSRQADDVAAGDVAAADWMQHAFGEVRRAAAAEPRRRSAREVRERCAEERGAEELAAQGREGFGPRWRSLRRLAIGEGEVLGRLELAEAFAADRARFLWHPAVLDQAVNVGGYLPRPGEGFYLPFSYARARFAATLPTRLWSHARLRAGERGLETLSFDLELFDDEGRVWAEIEGYDKKRVADPRAQLRQLEAAQAAGAAGRPAEAGEGAEPPAPRLPDAISTAEGLEVFSRLLGRPLEPHVVVCPRDLEALIEAAREASAEKVLEQAAALAPSDAAGRRARPELEAAYRAPGDELERRLAALWQQYLGLERVGVDDNYFALGGDSVMAIQIIARARAEGLAISPNQLFEHQSIAELAAVLRRAEPAGGAPEATETAKTTETTEASVPPAAEIERGELEKLAGLVAEIDGGGG